MITVLHGEKYGQKITEQQFKLMEMANLVFA